MSFLTFGNIFRSLSTLLILVLLLLFFLPGMPNLMITRAQSSPELTSTFESISIYLNWPNCSGTRSVEYKKSGTNTWKKGHPIICKTGQFRGSLVRLNSGTLYDIRIEGNNNIYQERTWSDNFPIGKTTTLPSSVEGCVNNANLYISSSDSGAENGYHLFRPSGNSTILDGDSNGDGIGCNYNIFVDNNAHHIIISGLEMKNALTDAIMLSDGNEDDPNDGARHIVIDGNDIHSWGESGLEAGEDHGAIASEFTCKDCLGGVKNIIIQNNKIHHPNGNSNTWETGHPQGPRAVHLVSPQGQIVIRNNHMWSDNNHQYNDVIGGRKNDGPVGSVGRDSDIYGNTISHCWDDGIEVEGDNTNVRVYENKVSNCYIGIAFASTVYGPLYVFNNLITDNARSFNDDKAYGFKMGNSGAECHSDPSAFGMNCGDGYGYIYLYHNTVAADNYSYAPENGASDSGGPVKYLTSKNNIFNGTNDCIDAPNTSNSSQNDVCNGNFDIGIITNPSYGEATFQSGTHIPNDSSIAKDAGVIIYGFNDNFTGSAPDAGWRESGGIYPTNSPIPTEQACTETNGDANGDSVANGNDFTAWLRNFDPVKPVSGGPSAGDFNCDGFVNGNDFTNWLRNFSP